MEVEIVPAKDIIPSSYDEGLLQGTSEFRIIWPRNPRTPDEGLPLIPLTRTLALRLSYPLGTKIEPYRLSRGEDYSRASSIRPPNKQSYSSDLVLVKIPAHTEIWIKQAMKSQSPDQYARLLQIAHNLIEELMGVRDHRIASPKFIDSPDFFEDSLSPWTNKTFYHFSWLERREV